MKRMTFSWTAAAVVCLWTGAASAQLAWSETERRLSPEADQTHAVAEFRFTNAGRYSLTIVEVDAPRDCRVTRDHPGDEPRKNTFRPGESGTIRVTHELGRAWGAYERVVTVKTDERDGPATRLILKVTVPPRVAIEPRQLRWEVGGAAEPKTVTITPAAGVELGGLDAALRPGVAGGPVTLEAAENPAIQGGYLLTVTPTDLSKPAFTEVVLRTGLPESRTPRLSVRVLITPVRPEPPQERPVEEAKQP